MFVPVQSVAIIEQQFADQLADLYSASEARQLCYMLFEDRLGWSKATYLHNKQARLDTQDTLWFTAALSALKSAKPIQYILGHAWFMGMKLTVNDAVLIPRPETEELIHLIISHYQNSAAPHLHIIDIGTGSGCIAIALKKAFPTSSCYALDISAEALEVARRNSVDQHVDITFIQADMLEWDTFFKRSQTFDIVVSNPPYITAAEQEEMHKNVLAYEPHMALFVENHTPLLFYDHIAGFAQKHLLPGGSLYFEINRRYGQQVDELLQKKGFSDVQVQRDIHGADRMIYAKKSTSQ